jgi:hypothetical protein
MVAEVRSNRMPDGGLVVTFTDVTPSIERPKRWSGPTPRWKSACASARKN